MRRVRLEKLSAKKNCPARRNQPSGRRHPRGDGLSTSTVSIASDDDTSSAFRLESGCVRSSNGQNCRLFRLAPLQARSHCIRKERRRQLTNRGPNAGPSGLLEAIAYPVQRLDHLEFIIHDLELLAQPLDVAVDGAIINIDLI